MDATCRISLYTKLKLKFHYNFAFCTTLQSLIETVSYRCNVTQFSVTFLCLYLALIQIILCTNNPNIACVFQCILLKFWISFSAFNATHLPGHETQSTACIRFKPGFRHNGANQPDWILVCLKWKLSNFCLPLSSSRMIFKMECLLFPSFEPICKN